MSSLAYAALWFFVFSVPWQNVIGLPGVGAVSRLTGMVALGLALLAIAVTGRFRRWHLFHVVALVFVIWAGINVLVLGLGLVPKKFWTFVQLFLVAWMIWELAPSRKRLHGLLTAYVSGAYISALGTILEFRRNTGASSRFAAAGLDGNDLAAMLALALPMAWYLSTVHHQPLMRWVFRSYLAISLLAIGLTGSRGGMLATIVALLIVPLTMTKLSPGRLVTAIAILCISGSVAVAYIPETIVELLSTTRSDVQEGHFGGRFKLWVAGVRAFSRQPVTGYCTSSFKTATAPFLMTTPQVAHNTYLSVLVEQGIVGFLLCTWLIIAVLRSVLPLPQLDRRFALVLLATLAVVMLPLTWEDHKPVWIILAALLGLGRASVARVGPALAGQPQQWRAAPVANAPMAPRPRPPVTARHWNAGRDARA